MNTLFFLPHLMTVMELITVWKAFPWNAHQPLTRFCFISSASLMSSMTEGSSLPFPAMICLMICRLEGKDIIKCNTFWRVILIFYNRSESTPPWERGLGAEITGFMKVLLDIEDLSIGWFHSSLTFGLALCSVMNSMVYNAQNLGLQQPLRLLSTPSKECFGV